MTARFIGVAAALVWSAVLVDQTAGHGEAQAVAAVVGTSTSVRHDVPLGLDLYMPVPEENPITAEKLTLGRTLFFDTRLSVDRTTACATCHVPERAFTDGKQVAEGVQGRKGVRNAPTLINRGYGASHFLDGRAGSLEEQVLQPIEGDVELAYEIALAVSRLQQHDDYQRAFDRAFGRPPDAETLAWALASYVRSILAGDSPVDRFRRGDRRALSPRGPRGCGSFSARATAPRAMSVPTSRTKSSTTPA